MLIQENYSLRTSNTFGIHALARYYAEVSSHVEIRELLADSRFKENDRLFLGGGSNILLSQDYTGLVVKINLMGIEVLKEDDHACFIGVGAGENWHDLVTYCINHGYSGIENLSLIPGNVGAAPMQNIGAYGVEFKDVFHELIALNIYTGEEVVFSKSDCCFGYRTSVFKEGERGNYVICKVVLRLRKNPVFNVSYGAIQKELDAMAVTQLSIEAIGKAVCNIRRSKLPDPIDIGNAGSFFKNPIIDGAQFEELKKQFPQIVGFKGNGMEVKVAAGWLIEQCNWKGKRVGDAGVHADHALVLVNYGSATGEEIYRLSEKINESVREKFGINLEREVSVI